MDQFSIQSPIANGHQLPRLYTYKQLWLLGETHFYHVDITNMGLTKEDLLAHSRYIRDTLVPRLAKDKTVVSSKDRYDLTHLREALEELHDSPMTMEILSFSRIEKALQRIAEAQGSHWPPDIVVKAKNLLGRWEETLGPLWKVRTDFWGAGGRLEGLAKSEDHLKHETDYAQQVRRRAGLSRLMLNQRQRYQRRPIGQSSAVVTWAEHTELGIWISRLESEFSIRLCFRTLLMVEHQLVAQRCGSM